MTLGTWTTLRDADYFREMESPILRPDMLNSTFLEYYPIINSAVLRSAAIVTAQDGGFDVGLTEVDDIRTVTREWLQQFERAQYREDYAVKFNLNHHTDEDFTPPDHRVSLGFALKSLTPLDQRATQASNNRLMLSDFLSIEIWKPYGMPLSEYVLRVGLYW